MSHPVLRVLSGEEVWPPPVWLMRQAGRYLPEYRKIRAEAGDFIALCTAPKLAAEVTLQPIRRYGFDAAILFSDILILPWALGYGLEFKEGEGPVLPRLEDEAGLATLDPGRVGSAVEPILETVRRCREGLGPETVLIGFAGGPFTVACYMVEGGGSKEHARIRTMAQARPELLDRLIDTLTESTIEYLSAQATAGAQVLKIFDSWAGVLSPRLFKRYVTGPTQRIVKALRERHPDVPLIGFPRLAGLGAGHYAIDALTPGAFRALWQPLIASGPIEISVFGDFKADDALAAVAATFGALPPRTVDATPAPPVRFPAHVDTPVMRQHNGAANQAVAVIAWPTGAGIDDILDSRRLDVLAQVFSDRLFEKLRQADGASYSPNVSSSWPIGLPGGGRMVAIGQVAPANVPLFFTTARAIAADLVANPIGQDELVRIMGPMRQVLIRAATGNPFWLQLMAGATFDPRRIDATRSIAKDFLSITPADLQAAAAKYLVPARDWTMAVVPKPAKTGDQPAVGAPAATR